MKHSAVRLAIATIAVGTLGLTTACGSGRGEGNADGVTTIQFWQNQFSNEDNAWFKKACAGLQRIAGRGQGRLDGRPR